MCLEKALYTPYKIITFYWKFHRAKLTEAVRGANLIGYGTALYSNKARSFRSSPSWPQRTAGPPSTGYLLFSTLGLWGKALQLKDHKTPLKWSGAVWQGEWDLCSDSTETPGDP